MQRIFKEMQITLSKMLFPSSNIFHTVEYNLRQGKTENGG